MKNKTHGSGKRGILESRQNYKIIGENISNELVSPE